MKLYKRFCARKWLDGESPPGRFRVKNPKPGNSRPFEKVKGKILANASDLLHYAQAYISKLLAFLIFCFIKMSNN
jgi:hypothetical protein